MREKSEHSRATFATTLKDIEKRGVSATHLGEQRAILGQGLDPLVNPKLPRGVRESRNLLIPAGDGTFVLRDGIAMPVRTSLDTTGSMGDNVDIAFKGIPANQDLLVQVEKAILRRYHPQFATAIIQDRGDKDPAYQHTQYEPDNEIDRQMGLLAPSRNGGDPWEEYQLDLYYVGYQTETDIVRYGLKGYNFIVGDQRGRDSISIYDAKEFLGVDLQDQIYAEKLGKAAKAAMHTFFLQVGLNGETESWWNKVIGPERVILLPKTEDIPFVQAVVCGLTEGVLDLQNSVDFLTEYAKVGNNERPLSKEEAGKIVRAVQHIPLRAQADLPGFNRIPAKGSIFASREDIFPISDESIMTDTPDPEANYKL